MTRQLIVKLKFEVEEQGGVTTALLRVPDHAPLVGKGSDAETAVLDLLSQSIVHEQERLVLTAVLAATQEACLGALWTP